MAASAVVGNRGFWFHPAGAVLSQVGTRGTVTANLYQVYELTGSTIDTGLVGLSQVVARLVFSPLGGVYADRQDRRRLLRAAQGVALVVAAGVPSRPNAVPSYAGATQEPTNA